MGEGGKRLLQGPGQGPEVFLLRKIEERMRGCFYWTRLVELLERVGEVGVTALPPFKETFRQAL